MGFAFPSCPDCDQVPRIKARMTEVTFPLTSLLHLQPTQVNSTGRSGVSLAALVIQVVAVDSHFCSRFLRSELCVERRVSRWNWRGFFSIKQKETENAMRTNHCPRCSVEQNYTLGLFFPWCVWADDAVGEGEYTQVFVRRGTISNGIHLS